jgi:hypothetical protein
MKSLKPGEFIIENLTDDNQPRIYRVLDGSHVRLVGRVTRTGCWSDSVGSGYVTQYEIQSGRIFLSGLMPCRVFTEVEMFERKLQASTEGI